MIIATSGHIDHGKTMLVKALTGVDTDRLPEEKNRGISIDLGYAYHALEGGEVLGFIDVPGHERFVRNMLAGVTGIDYALLIVAADDGPMPQTEEHLAILDLLGLRHGAIVLTKTDRVDAARVEEVSELIEILLDGTNLEGAPVFPVSSITGDGIPALRSHLADTAREIGVRRTDSNFRLAIDRRFIVPGAGLVVTGTVFSGTVAVDDHLILSPSGLAARVRGIHAQNSEAATGLAGQRCALNITGPDIEHSAIHRGDWITAEVLHAPTRRIDARIRLLKSEARALRHWTPVHLHIGAADIGARVAVLDGRQIEPGSSALVQLVLDEPTSVLRDDRLILRDQSARRTIAGGRALDPFAPARGRAKPERIAVIEAQEDDNPVTALAALLTLLPNGVDLARFALARNLDRRSAGAIFAEAEMVQIGGAGEENGIAAARWQSLEVDTLDALTRFHQEKPDVIGIAENTLRLSFSPPPPPSLFNAVIGKLAARGQVVAANRQIRLPDHQPKMSSGDKKIWAKIEPVLEAGNRQPLTVHEMATELGAKPDTIFSFMRRAVAMGLVIGVARNRFLLPAAIRELGIVAEALAKTAEDGMITAGEFRNAAGIGRNLTIELLEFFDRAGMTHRIGNARKIIRPSVEIFGHSDNS
jgi:selenocysteine-specific elongation factor